jgi:hypothetical protein
MRFMKYLTDFEITDPGRDAPLRKWRCHHVLTGRQVGPARFTGEDNKFTVFSD